jgi:hypothetical protein
VAVSYITQHTKFVSQNLNEKEDQRNKGGMQREKIKQPINQEERERNERSKMENFESMIF